MAEFVLTNNVFEFDNICKKQISGTAMGTKFAPPYACIFMDKLETDFLQGETLKPWCWMRYIDDIFFVWTHGKESLDVFFEHLNKVHSNIKFTFETSLDNVNFLDIKVSLKDQQFTTNLFCKPTDCHQFLHYDSCHPEHTKKSTVYSQGLRIRKICSQEDEFLQNISKLTEWFRKRSYPEKVINEEIDKVRNKTRESLFETKQKESKNAVPFVVDFCPALKSLPQIIRTNFFVL